MSANTNTAPPLAGRPAPADEAARLLFGVGSAEGGGPAEDIRPVFLDTQGPPIAGWLHVPADRRARAGVVVCPGIGLDELSSHRALRALAVALQHVGFLVLRIDYRGTGDAGGELDEVATVEDWIEDVETAMAQLREWGAERLALVGLRLGAAFAAAAAARAGGVEALVLWDACTSGRSFLRQQQALTMLSSSEPTVEAAGTGEVELMAMHLPARLAESLTRFGLERPSAPWAGEVAVFKRASSSPDRRLEAALEGRRCSVREVFEQEQFLDVEPWRSVVPVGTIGEIATYLDGAVGGATTPVAIAEADRRTLEVAPGRLVTERACCLPPHAMAAVVTEPAATDWVGPTVVFLNAGLIHKPGAGRFAVGLGRQLAAKGMRTVRLDLPGIGDSEAMPGQPSAPYPLGAEGQLVETLQALNPGAPSEVVLVGLCSGGYYASRVAAALGARGACLLNPALYEGIAAPPPAAVAGSAAEAQVLGAANPLLRLLRRSPLVKRLAKLPQLRRVYYSDALARLVDGLPVIWAVLDAVGSGPGGHLRALGEKQVTTLLVCGPEDVRRYRRRRPLLRRLARDGLRYVEVEGIDHPLFTEAARRRVGALVERHLTETYLLGPGLVGPGQPSSGR